jgi:hypothetical protein
MVIIDAWKKAADDTAQGLARSGYGNAARVVGDMKNRVVSVVDQYNPAYKAARDAWAGPTRYLDALEQGRRVTKDSADDVRATLSGLGNSEREAYVTGALASIFGKMGNDPARLGDMTKYLRSPQMRAKVAALMPDDAAREAWNKRLDFEVGASELTGRALGNSATARRQAEQDATHELAADLVMGAFAGAPPVHFLQKFLGMLPTKIRDTVRSRSDRALAGLLTDPNAVGTGEMARILSGAQPYSVPPSALGGVLPANAVGATREP